MIGKLKLGELLVKEKKLTSTQLTEALQVQMVCGGRLGTNLLESGFITEQALNKTLSEQLGMSTVGSAELIDVPKSVITKLGRAEAEKYQVIPFRYKKEERRLDVALVDPAQLSVVEELSSQTGLTVEPHLATEAAISHALERYYGITSDRRYVTAPFTELHASGV